MHGIGWWGNGKREKQKIGDFLGVKRIGGNDFMIHIHSISLTSDISRGSAISLISHIFPAISTVEIRETVQNDFDMLALCMKDNRLVLNKTKTKIILFGTKKKLDTAQDFNISPGPEY